MMRPVDLFQAFARNQARHFPVVGKTVELFYGNRLFVQCKIPYPVVFIADLLRYDRCKVTSKKIDWEDLSMFKAFLRTDGAVVVTGGDVAWQFQRRQFQRLVTKMFASTLKSMPETTVLSDFSSKERTVVCDVAAFIGSDAAKVTDTEYQYCRAVLKEIVERKDSNRNGYAVAG
jgi:hypothetical protein